MSEEEVIKEVKKQIEDKHNLNDINIFVTDTTTLKMLLNCIDKLQEENEKLKYNQLEADELIKALEEKNEEQEKELLHWKGQYHLLSRKIDYISKDKIRDKIKEAEFYIVHVDNAEGQAMYKVLNELLEEE